MLGRYENGGDLMPDLDATRAAAGGRVGTLQSTTTPLARFTFEVTPAA